MDILHVPFFMVTKRFALKRNYQIEVLYVKQTVVLFIFLYSKSGYETMYNRCKRFIMQKVKF